MGYVLKRNQKTPHKSMPVSRHDPSKAKRLMRRSLSWMGVNDRAITGLGPTELFCNFNIKKAPPCIPVGVRTVPC